MNATDRIIGFVNGAVAMSYVVAGVCFLRFWRKTRDQLFLSFATAFALLAINLAIVAVLDVTDERTGYAYVLRVLGFGFILYAIFRKNLARGRGDR